MKIVTTASYMYVSVHQLDKKDMEHKLHINRSVEKPSDSITLASMQQVHNHNTLYSVEVTACCDHATAITNSDKKCIYIDMLF